MSKKYYFLLKNFRLIACSSEEPENAPQYAIRDPKIKKSYVADPSPNEKWCGAGVPPQKF